jgi:predicted RNase H-like HicB family nuclease
MDLKCDVKVERVGDVFVAVCGKPEVSGKGKTKAEAIDACDKAILAHVLASKTKAPEAKAEVLPASEEPTAPALKKPAKG